MKFSPDQNAIAALLDEYKKAVYELQNTIRDVSTWELIQIVDAVTKNDECRSIQTVLTHVVSAGYSYCVYILNLKDPAIKRPAKKLLSSASEYRNELDNVLAFTYHTFINLKDSDIEEYDDDKKIFTSWGQKYDIEQIMEHAIVHILRHRRQIERFKTLV
ncbi:MAG: DinB family protein [Saprospiraceae bacterium]|nr:DinB family protein [Saprospiraceae bacterium]